MVADQLNFKFLNEFIDNESFGRLKECYEELLLDAHFNNRYNDKELGVQLFLNTIEEDFFSNKTNLKSFIKALPRITQNRIVNDLGLVHIEDVIWDVETSNYFIYQLKLPSRFGLEVSTCEKEKVGYKEFEKPAIKFKNLKEYQSQVFFKTYNYISDVPYARCIIQMPTGSGKTRTAMEIVCELINDSSGDVLWLANTQELCDQAFEAFIEVWQFIGKKKCAAINHVISNNSARRNFQAFHVSTIQSFREDKIGEKFKKFGISELSLVVIDEAHIAVAPTYKQTLLRLNSNGAKLLGLTATPGRKLVSHPLGNQENVELSDFFFNTIFQLETEKENPIDYLRSKGILANAVFTSIEGSIVEGVLSESEVRECRLKKTIPSKIISILTNDSSRNSKILDKLFELLDEEKKVLFFGTSLDHSKMISTIVKMKGFSAAHVDGSSGNFRRKAINDFKKGDIQLLSNYGVLSTGFDDPLIDVVFMARPTNSIVLYSQILGRGLRGPLIGGTDFCEIITVFDNISDLPENRDIYSYFDDYFIAS